MIRDNARARLAIEPLKLNSTEKACHWNVEKSKKHWRTNNEKKWKKCDKTGLQRSRKVKDDDMMIIYATYTRIDTSNGIMYNKILLQEQQQKNNTHTRI